MKIELERKKEITRKTSLREKGITLIALIVTIIVLLVLAGVTIANVMGNQGVIKKAKIAANNYDMQSANEEMELFLMGLGNDITGDRLADYLKNYIGNDGLEDFQNNGDGTGQLVLNGKKYTLHFNDLTFTYDGKGTGIVRNLKQVLNNNNQNVPGVAMVGAGDIETEDLGWEVLSTNSDGTVNLIAINNTNFELNISGINGYTNGVKALNDICNKLYGNLEINGKKVISARSVNADDFYDITYSTTKTYSSASKVQPYIAKLDTENNGFSKDQITNYIDPSNTSESQSSNTQMLNSPATGVKIVRPTTITNKQTAQYMYTGNQYWIATRENYSAYDSNAWKDNGGDTDNHRREMYRLYYSRADGISALSELFVIYYTNTSGNNQSQTCALRPVITVSGDLIKDKSIGAKVSTDPFYKGKTGTEAHGYVRADSLSSLLGVDIKGMSKIDAGLPVPESDMTWTKLTDGGYNSADSASGSFDTSKYDYYIADRTTKLQVRLTGAQGYNNGVLALDTICNNIYGGETSIKLRDGTTKKVKVKQARNAKFEDFWDESKIKKSTTEGYGATYSTDQSKASSTASGSTGSVIASNWARWTPSIYRLENAIDANNPSSGYSDAKIKSYNLSANTNYFNKSNTSLTDENMNSYSAEYRYPDMTVMYNALGGIGANRNTAVSKTSDSHNYWLSSRCVQVEHNGANFSLHNASRDGILRSDSVFYSDTYVHSPSNRLRPVLVVEK